ncbi:aminodeoxychorismate synthase component I [Hirschia maritima]|uniref:aminodeoxychorismate synthase component I n=1 Tax=Hirschia maritima TaxID=1121961 RepID=UPI000374BF2B|nr:aminodeoxychorismate synthase component I [Hirschia maritima]
MFKALEFPYNDPIMVFEPLRDLPFAMLMHGKGKRWSYICAQPLETILFRGDGTQSDAALCRLEQSLKKLEFVRPKSAPPFCGGWAGLLSYEFGRSILPKLQEGPDFSAWPDLALGLYDQVLAFDHEEKRARLYIWDWEQIGRSSQRKETLVDALKREGKLNHNPNVLCDEMPTPREELEHYKTKIQKTVDYIHAGDCFQSNISQAFDFTLSEGVHPYHLIKRLNETSAAPFSSYFRLDGLVLASNSPERFLKTRLGIDGELYVSTKPIKGTRPRGKSDAEDITLASELLSSEKDRAENLMIVDLMRNDLSRVSIPGSVKVPKLNALESFANVHHLVSTVTARLQDDKGPVDLLRAAFPGGSITGAPKIRAMQIIAEMEDAARGPYCGSLLWVSPDGCMDSSILIRSTAFSELNDGWKGEFRVGGGIVADSVPEDEYQETIHKGQALIKALTQSIGVEKHD